MSFNKTVPVLDLQSITSNSDYRVQLGNELREKLGQFGLIQIINHSIPDDIISKVFDLSRKLFSLPDQIKEKYPKPPFTGIDSWYGYTKAGEVFGTDAELRETFDWIEDRGIYPEDELPGFYSTLEEFYKHIKVVTGTLFQLLAIGLDLDDPDYFLKFFTYWNNSSKDGKKGICNLRLAHYPKVSEIPENGAIRIGEHRDLALLTLLFQDDAGGLEVKDIDGEWIPVKPIPGAIVVNAGDPLEFWTNGIIPAAPHRVVVPDTIEKRSRPRYSVGSFHGPDIPTIIAPLPINKTKEEEQRINRMQKDDRFRLTNDGMLDAYEHCIRIIHEFVAGYWKAKEAEQVSVQ